jgi:preprotein translocase subunit YajC
LEIIFPVLIVGAFYFLLIRPQKQRARAAMNMQENLEPGRQVMTTSGLFATVIRVDDDALELEVAPGVRTRWMRGAIARVIPLEEPEDTPMEPPGTSA